MPRGVLSLLQLALLCLFAQPAGAQQPVAVAPTDNGSDPPAHVSFVEGAATLERDGQPDAAPLNMPLLAGDRVRTDSGRVEILFGDGSTLHLDRDTLVDFQSDDLVRLLRGRVRLSIPGATRDVSYRVDTPWASADIMRPGEYRVSMLAGERGDEIELAVIRGVAELVNEQGRTPLRAGERAFARANAAPSYAYVYNSAAWDAFDQWSEGRRDQRLGVSTQYLPESVRPYAASFDRDGWWRYQSSYGYVWYPRVHVGWRPYYNGRWVTLRPWGWTWIGYESWAWPTHHYGRWGFSAGSWFWIPGRSWGPAWVSWAYAPGYVSWCPLGWNNRPVLQIVNVYGRGYDPWSAWTVLPRHHFNGHYVNVRGAGRFEFDSRARTSFAIGARGPDHPAYAVPRAAAPIRAAGTGRRSATSPLYTNLEPRDGRVGSAPSRTVIGARPQPEASAQPRTRQTYSNPPASRREGGPAAPSAAAPPAGQRPSYGRTEPPANYGRTDRSAGVRPVESGAAGREASPMAVPRTRSYDAPAAPAAGSRGADLGSGGAAWSPRTDQPAPSYGRPSRERGADMGSAPSSPYMGGRAMPRDEGDRPPAGYRSAPREARPEAAPARGSDPAPPPRADSPRGESRPPAGAPAAGAPRPSGARPSGGPPAGQARPRGGRGGN